MYLIKIILKKRKLTCAKYTWNTRREFIIKKSKIIYFKLEFN